MQARLASAEAAGVDVGCGRRELEELDEQLQYAELKAPFDGVVADLAVEVGEVAGPGSPVVRLVALDPVEIETSKAALSPSPSQIPMPIPLLAGCARGVPHSPGCGQCRPRFAISA